MRSKPTIRDVAREAGVSIATVSYVLNGNSAEAISARVQERVRRAVRALNYHRAAAAVSLARQRTRNIGIILYPVDSDVTNPFYSFVIQGVIREAMGRDYNLLFSYIESPYGGSRELPQIIREANVVGVLFVGRIDRALAEDIGKMGIAVVGVDCGQRIEGVTLIQIDNRGGGELVAAHLVGLGHEHAAFVGLVPGVSSIAERCEAFVRGMSGTRRSRRTVKIVACDALAFQQGYDRTIRLLRENPEITAIFCANDEVAAGVLRAAREVGRVIPGDLSVVGFDDIIMAHYTDPPLTTVSVPKEQLGRRGTARLIDAVDGPPGSAREEVVPVSLAVRQSTAPPKRRAAGRVASRAHSGQTGDASSRARSRKASR